MIPIALTVNGVRHEVEVEPRTLLVDFLRDDLDLTGTKIACDTSVCGACTIHLDGQAVKSCTVLAVQADGAEITTIEGLASGRRAASAAGGLLGAARPAMRLLHARDDHDRRRAAPARTATGSPIPRSGAGSKGNLCRCTGYQHIIEAVREAAGSPAGR